MIGRGSYGKVYLVNYITNSKVYAMKSIKKELILKTDQVEGTKGKTRVFLCFKLQLSETSSSDWTTLSL